MYEITSSQGRGQRSRSLLEMKLPPTHALWLLLLFVGIIQTLLVMKSYNYVAEPQANSHDRRPSLNDQNYLVDTRSVSLFWWPSPQTSGGFLSAIHNAQHPRDCMANSTRFFVMQSLKKNGDDNRGLSAWASITMQNMLHAFSDGDNPKYGRRVLLTDNKLWPMAKGCKHGPETRECYFLPLTNCQLSDADPIDGGSVAVLASKEDDYDRRVRTLYSAQQRYARLTDNKVSWSHIPWRKNDFSLSSLTAHFLAYTLQPQPWLKSQINSRLRRSIPVDLDPERTVGVPLRRSDKCFGHEIEGSAGGELDCPPLEDYLDAVKNFTMFDPLIQNVVVTSEDSAAYSDFIAMLRRELPNLRIITNVGDVQQGTGSASKLEAYNAFVDNADAIASALTSFHMHMRARYFVLTTKSIWTTSIAIFSRTFGFASDIYVIDIGRNKNLYSDLARKGG